MDQETKISLYDTAPTAMAKRRAPTPPSFEADESEKVPDLVEYGRVIKKRRATIFTIAFVVFTIGLFATLKEKPVYRARVLVEIRKHLGHLPRNAVPNTEKRESRAPRDCRSQARPARGI